MLNVTNLLLCGVGTGVFSKSSVCLKEIGISIIIMPTKKTKINDLDIKRINKTVRLSRIEEYLKQSEALFIITIIRSAKQLLRSFIISKHHAKVKHYTSSNLK